MKNDSLSADERGFFEGWSMRRKLSFGAGLVVILALVLGLAWWVQRAPQAVLFSDLADRDAAVITAELDKLKHPYTLSDDGHAILVAGDSVHRTRLALMGKQLPLHGAVGFELFNNADFGVSDFVQKVNYQRALQGELTRTILAIEQVQDARVHLALPDQTLFRKDAQKAKASVTVSLKGNQSLRADQVAGIQRLIGASVPEVKAEDVTVLDQHGVVLSRAGSDESALALGQLDARQSLESHLTRKASRLLDQMFSAGEAMVAVDVVLSHEQSKVTTEEVLGAAQADRGVITRERMVTKEPAGAAGNASDANSAQVLTQETDYAAGRRTAQTVSQGGQIARLNIAVVVKRNLSDSELTRVRQLVATAVGLQPSRGDAVTVHSLAELSATAAPAASQAALAVPAATPGAARAMAPAQGQNPTVTVVWVLAGLLVLVLLIAGLLARSRRRPAVDARPALTERERRALLASLKTWLEPQS